MPALTLALGSGNRSVPHNEAETGEHDMRGRNLIAPLILIVLGSLFLLQNLGLMPHLGPLLARWWPVILIVVGVSMLLRRR
jgi:hypothetical protein